MPDVKPMTFSMSIDLDGDDEGIDRYAVMRSDMSPDAKEQAAVLLENLAAILRDELRAEA